MVSFSHTDAKPIAWYPSLDDAISAAQGIQPGPAHPDAVYAGTMCACATSSFGTVQRLLEAAGWMPDLTRYIKGTCVVHLRGFQKLVPGCAFVGPGWKNCRSVRGGPSALMIGECVAVRLTEVD
jgi:hypothetical protein